MQQYYILGVEGNTINQLKMQLGAGAQVSVIDSNTLPGSIPQKSALLFDCSSIQNVEPLLPVLFISGCDCIGVYRDRSNINREHMIRFGIPAAFYVSECSSIPYYCTAFTGSINGTVGIVDSNSYNVRGLSLIIKKYGYSTLEYTNLETCCAANDMVDMLCINCSQISTHEIAKMHIAGKLPKKNSIVLYKSDEADIFIHDIIKLNRLATVIYTLEEVYIMLAQLLFMQQFHAHIYTLYDTSKMNTTTTSYRGSLRQWYMEAGTNVFDTSGIMSTKLLSCFEEEIKSLKLLVARAKAFRWLIQPKN
ncbi:MAG: hypothetical protein WBK20_03610 [Spirochaetota bacterium]